MSTARSRQRKARGHMLDVLASTAEEWTDMATTAAALGIPEADVEAARTHVVDILRAAAVRAASREP